MTTAGVGFVATTKVGRFCDRFLEAGWLATIALVPLFFNIYSNRVFEPDKLTLLRLIVLLMVVAWAIRTIESPPEGSLATTLSRFLDFSPLIMPVLIYVAVYFVTTATSVAVPSSVWGSYHRLQGLVTNLSYFFLFFIVATNLRQRAQLERLVTVILLASIPICFYGLLQHSGNDPVPWGGDVTVRVTSTMGNPIFLGAYLVMVIPVAMARLAEVARRLIAIIRAGGSESSSPRKDRTERWQTIGLLVLYAVILTLQLINLLYTQSRGPWMGFLASMVFLAILLPLRANRRRQAALATIGSLAALAFIVLINLPGNPVSALRSQSQYLDRLGTILDLESGTNKVRLLIWFGDDKGRGALGMITANPLRTAIGYGPESMFVAYNPFYPPDLGHYEARNAVPDRSHNDLLDQLVTMGVIGLAGYLLVVGTFFAVLLRFLWRTRVETAQLVAFALATGVVAYLVESFFGIGIVASRTHFWTYAAIAAALPTLDWSFQRKDAPARDRAAQPTQRSGRRRAATTVAAPSASPWWRDWTRYPLLGYLLLSLLMVPQLIGPATARQVQLNPQNAAWIAFLWIVLGILLATPWLKQLEARRGPPLRWVRPRAMWAYAPLLALTIFAAHSLLSVVIADVYFKIGQEFDRSERFEGAVPAYMAATTWGSGQDVYFSHLGGAFLRLAEKASGSPLTVTTNVTVADLRSPDFMRRQFSRGDLLATAKVALDEAVRLNPLNPDNPTNVGRMYAFWAQTTDDTADKERLFAAAHVAYQQATSLRPNAAHLIAEEAWVYMLQGHFDDAEATLRHGLWIDSLYPQTYAYLGDTLRLMGRPADAFTVYVQGGNAFAAAKSWNDAAVMYNSALSIDAMSMAARLGLIDAFLGQAKLQEALVEAQRAVAADSSDANAHAAMARALRAANLLADAKREAQLALDLARPEQRAAMAELLRTVSLP